MPDIATGGISIKVDETQIAKMANAFKAAGARLPQVMVGSLKHVGDKALTQMRRETVKQTGLKMKTIRKAVTGSVAGGQAYVIKSKGGNVRLKFFRPRETRKGLTAYPRNQKTLYKGVFMKGGKFPNRHGGIGSPVMRAGSARLPLKAAPRSGVYIPDEMVTGGSAAAFYSTVQAEYPKRLEREVYRILGAL